MDNKIEERYIFLDFDGVLNTMEYRPPAGVTL